MVGRRAQTTVETMLLISVLVIGAVSIGWLLVGNNSGKNIQIHHQGWYLIQRLRLLLLLISSVF